MSCNPSAVCFGAATAGGAFTGAMTTGTQFTAGADLDPSADSLSSTLVFANNTTNAPNGGTNDITLVVQRPDGTYLCNDDSDGLNPMVEGPFAAGAYQIFVGAYSAEAAGASYRLGISELPTTTPTSLGAP